MPPADALTVDALETERDEHNDREQLTSRLAAAWRDMSRYAEHLQFEHRSDRVRLHLARLTVVTDTPTWPPPLFASARCKLDWAAPRGRSADLSYAITTAPPERRDFTRVSPGVELPRARAAS